MLTLEEVKKPKINYLSFLLKTEKQQIKSKVNRKKKLMTPKMNKQ